MGVVAKPVKPRTYNNVTRRAQSEQTRQRILQAARDLMVASGYRTTTIAAIAQRAGVHVDTVYELGGRKPVILRELIEQALSGVDRAVTAEERDYVKELQDASDSRQKLIIYAAAVRTIQVRLAPLFLALRDASATEPEANDVWREISDRRASNMRKLAQDLEEAAGGLRTGVAIEEAADVLWATNSSEFYVLLTVERGWAPDRYERWLSDTWCRLLLPDTDPQ